MQRLWPPLLLLFLAACTQNSAVRLSLSTDVAKQGEQVTAVLSGLDAESARVRIVPENVTQENIPREPVLEEEAIEERRGRTLKFRVPIDLTEGRYIVQVEEGGRAASASLTVELSAAFTLLLNEDLQNLQLRRSAFASTVGREGFVVGDFERLQSNIPECNFVLASVANPDKTETEARLALERLAEEEAIQLDIDPSSIEARKAYLTSQETSPPPLSVRTDAEGDSPYLSALDLSGRGVRIAVLDTGLGRENSFGRVVSTIGTVVAPNYFSSDQDIYDEFVLNDRLNLRLEGHGTAVADLASGRRSRTPSEVEIMPIKVCQDNGTCFSNDVIEGLCYALANPPVGGLRDLVINMSFGGPEPSPKMYRVLAYALSRGASVVVSAGSVREGAPLQYPAAFGADGEFPELEGLVAVAALREDLTTPLFEFSADYIDLAAVGERVRALQAEGTENDFSGASFAAPQVAFSLALLREAVRDEAIESDELAARLESLLKSTATPIPGCPASACGSGRLSLNLNPVASFITNPPSGPAPLRVEFDGSTSSDADGSLVSFSFQWSFGDGATGSGPIVSHTYLAAGVYTVTLTVKDDQGATDEAQRMITVLSDGANTCTVGTSRVGSCFLSSNP